MPSLRAASGFARVNRFAVQVNLALVRDVNAGEDFAERAFARAVLTHERVATAARDVEAHAVQREHTGKAFGDVTKRYKAHPANGSPSVCEKLRTKQSEIRRRRNRNRVTVWPRVPPADHQTRSACRQTDCRARKRVRAAASSFSSNATDHSFGSAVPVRPRLAFDFPFAVLDLADLQTHLGPRSRLPIERHGRLHVLVFQQLQRLFTRRHLQLVTAHATQSDPKRRRTAALWPYRTRAR